jgi:hypothetical protein
MKINKKISQLEEQNTVLWSLIIGTNTHDEIKEEISLMRPPEYTITNAHSQSSKRPQHFN